MIAQILLIVPRGIEMSFLFPNPKKGDTLLIVPRGIEMIGNEPSRTADQRF